MLNIQGNIIKKGEKGFEDAIFSTMFNQYDPLRRPDAIIFPKSVEDVIATVRFAKQTDKKISVCSGGHSWSQNHLRNGSLLLNMKCFDQYEINREEMTATAGPAVGGSTLLGALFDQGLFFPAGHCKGVCLGGYLLQGGFAWNGRKLGLACESVIGLDIVTAAGELVYADPTQHADLYWAARGSGAGFFGVVVRFHLKLYPKPRYTGLVLQAFDLKHLESVFEWAAEAGSGVKSAVEFQLLMSRRTLRYLGPGIEAFAPVFADSQDELHAATAFLRESPIRKKAYFKLPYLNFHINTLYNMAMTHYPEKHHWGVDNMWTNAGIEELMPHLKDIAQSLPPAPSHFLWLNWKPETQRQDMAFSMENHTYLALYGVWKNAHDGKHYENWATERVAAMQHLGTGIQLADEGLHKRTSRFVSDAHLHKLANIRAQYDAGGVFHEWHSKPELKLETT